MTRQRLMRETYATVRENLGAAAVRRKRGYNVRVRSQQFHVGDQVWYYYPRRYAQRSPKWQSFYTGPYTVTRIIHPSNAVIKKGAKGTPIVVHLDKLKKCYGESDPVLDHASDTATSHPVSPVGPPLADLVPKREPQDSQPQDMTCSGSDPSSGVSERRPKRAAIRPARYRDFVL